VLKHLDLFSGIGGFSLGLEATGGFETVAFCDVEEFPRKVLQKHWPDVKQYKDIKELTYEKLKADGIDTIDIITGGYPCQPFSVAGRKKGEEDPRHLWPEYFRLVKECRPTWVIGENVSGHIKLGLDTVIKDLESEGYAVRPFSISASSVGANHQRERVWIMAYSERNDNQRKVSGVNGEEKEISREHRENDSTSWKSSEQIQYGRPTTEMWRTPDAHCGRGPSSKDRMKMKLEKGMPISLNDQVRHPNLMWPTPRASAAMGEKTETISKRLETKKSKGKLEESVAMVPTPTARDYKDNGLNTNYQKAKEKNRLAGSAGGSLNPTWVEWLMGYPNGWTDLKD
jgi:DNA (cytosine-5)-methyltransferase 1